MISLDLQRDDFACPQNAHSHFTRHVRTTLMYSPSFDLFEIVPNAQVSPRMLVWFSCLICWDVWIQDKTKTSLFLMTHLVLSSTALNCKESNLLFLYWLASGMDEAQARIQIARKNINHLRYADDTTLMAESEELKSLLMKVKEESEKSWLKTQHSEN